MISVKSLIVFTNYGRLASCLAQYLVVDQLQHLLFLQNLVIIKTLLNVRTCFTVCRSVLLVVASQVNTRLRSFLVSNESYQVKKYEQTFCFSFNWGPCYPTNLLVLILSTPETWESEFILYKMYKHILFLKTKNSLTPL